MTLRPSLPLLLIEAFAAAPHQGNGAAVVALDAPAGSAWMQAVAASLKQSETAFVVPWGEGWAIRWFTPACEVMLCGHATLAAALALRHWGSLRPGEAAVLFSRSGPLAVSLPAEGEGPPIATIELPGSPLLPSSFPEGLQDLLMQRLGAGAEQFWTSALGYAVALVNPDVDLAALDGLADQLPPSCRSGLVVMQAVSDRRPDPAPRVEGMPADYQLRFFAPALGIPEDPVTGSAHALVAPYWLHRSGRSSVRGWQCSPQGGGMVCESAGNGIIRLRGPGQVLLEGQVFWQEQICDPEAWSTLLATGDSR
ncbi:MAG: PhzF family phenazine biosynthesis protein [Cyanobacteriota bacterium]